MEQRLVVHFQDKNVKKGTYHDFFPNKNCFHLSLSDNSPDQKPLEIYMSKLKAVFFVKDFVGDKKYDELKDFSAAEQAVYGKRILVHLKDGEILYGFTQGYSPNRKGFFLFPLDPNSNNQKVFIVQAFVESVELPT